MQFEDADTPPLAIVMPTYNGMQFLREAIDSVLSQADKNWRLFIGDDGSNDGTRPYLASLNDPRIRVFMHEKNLGIFGNINFLVAQVKAPLTYILCQDDYFVGEHSIRKIKEEWARCPADTAFIRFNHTTDAHSPLERFEKEALPSVVPHGMSDLYFFVFGCVPGNLSNVCVRTPVVAEFGWFDQTLPYAGDFEFWSRVGRSRNWLITPCKVVEVRRHEGQASMNLNKRGELLAQLNRILERLFENLKAQGHSTFKLRTFATLCYVSMHRYVGVRQLMKSGSGLYLSLVQDKLGRSAYALPTGLAWLLFLVSGGGRFFRVQAAKVMLGGQARP
jgi:glycosyltransferase involved in cell wall biosynthesis